MSIKTSVFAWRICPDLYLLVYRLIYLTKFSLQHASHFHSKLLFSFETTRIRLCLPAWESACCRAFMVSNYISTILCKCPAETDCYQLRENSIPELETITINPCIMSIIFWQIVSEEIRLSSLSVHSISQLPNSCDWVCTPS